MVKITSMEMAAQFIGHDVALMDLLRKSRIAPVPYPTVHHIVTEMCTYMHISVTECCIVGYVSNALWALWDGSVERSKYTKNIMIQVGYN